MMTLIHKIFKIILFILFYTKEVLLANIRMAYLILSRNPKLKPAIITIPLETITETQIALLANLITMITSYFWDFQ